MSLIKCPECKNDGYRIGNQVLTFQGHPEIYPDFLQRYINIMCTHETPEKLAHAKELLKSPTDSILIAEFALRFFMQ